MENREFVLNYQRDNNIYSNFGAEGRTIWGLPENSTTMRRLDANEIRNYDAFLTLAIDHYKSVGAFFNNTDVEVTKKEHKFITYQQRLHHALQQLGVSHWVTK